MAETIYFQWQNPILLKTIYPLRLLKLQDFLVAMFEIETWQAFKDKAPQNIAADLNSYVDSQRRKLTGALDSYRTLEAYFLDPDVTDQYQDINPMDRATMDKINAVHALFLRFFPTYKNPVKEKYFIAERARQFEDLWKTTTFQISESKRKARNMAKFPTEKDKHDREAARLEKQVLPMVSRELGKLKDFLAAYERMGRYRQELIKRKTQRQKERDTSRSRVQSLRTEQEGLQKQIGSAQKVLKRMTAPPVFDQVLGYFKDTDVTDKYQRLVGQPDRDVLERIHRTHGDFARSFPSNKNPVHEKSFIDQRLQEFRTFANPKFQELASSERKLTFPDLSDIGRAEITKKVNALKSTTIPMLDEEITQFEDLLWAFELRTRPPADLQAQIAKKQSERAALEGRLQKLQDETRGHETVVRQADEADAVPERDQLVALVDPRQVTVKDIVRDKIENYRNELANKTHQELLEMIVKRFMDDPARYPLWLQYMVIHFSGMRYQSAHGSWADPKGLLTALRMQLVENELRGKTNEEILSEAEQRRLMYQSARDRSKILGGEPGEEYNLPALVTCSDKDCVEKVTQHLKYLDPDHWYNKRKVLLDLRVDEVECEIGKMDEKAVLEGLTALKDELDPWMWNEVVRLTELRLTNVKDENWEKLGEEEKEARNERLMDAFRGILNKWKADNLTNWRQEHDKTSNLVVSRAVCNEVAEHCQHERGLTPNPGLTAKPGWYRSAQKAAQDMARPGTQQPDGQPYLVKAQNPTDFKEGASILWISWVNKLPNDWQIARPMSLLNGEPILREMSDALNSVRIAGDHYERTTTVEEKDAAGKVIHTRQANQFLRWLHEATVAVVTETVDGPTVFTFETARPGDNRLQSTIGINRHLAANLRYQAEPGLLNGTFVGYMPAGKLPYEDVKDMLDWNHILLRDAYSEQQMKEYWQKMGRPAGVSFGGEFELAREETRVEVAPGVRPLHAQHRIPCFAIQPGSGAANRPEPEVTIKRGVRLTVCKDEVEQIDGERYYPVVHCFDEPCAENLYLRAADVIETGDGEAARGLATRHETMLYRLSGADGQARPVFEPGEKVLSGKMPLKVSTVHCLGPRDPGNGVIRAKNGAHFYLIVESPYLPSAAGWFVKKKDLKEVRQRKGKKNL